jgi:hypothetical protein
MSVSAPLDKNENSKIYHFSCQNIDILTKLISSVEDLRTKENFDQIKTKILYDILEGLIVIHSFILIVYLEHKKS